MFSNANNGQYQIWCNYSAAEVMFQNIGQLLKGSLSINLSEVGRILRLGGPKKNFRGGAFSPEIFWIFQTEILEFWGILVPENISGGNPEVIYYFYYFHGEAGQDYWGAMALLAPSNYLTVWLSIKKPRSLGSVTDCLYRRLALLNIFICNKSSTSPMSECNHKSKSK